MESGSNLPATSGNYSVDSERQQYCVSWNSHQSNMHSAFPKLLSAEQFVDVTLACDGGSIKCHKVVLSACSDYLERLLLDIPCTHPIIFLRDMCMWELHALVEFMYRGEVYVEKQQLTKLMQAAEALQVRGLSSQGRSETAAETIVPTQVPTASSKSEQMNSPEQSTSSDFKSEEMILNDGPELTGSEYLDTTIVPATEVPPPSIAPANVANMNMQNVGSSSTYTDQSEALQNLERALSACEATLTETPGHVKMEPDDHFTQHQELKPYSISMVPNSMNCSPGSPFPAIEGYQRRQRRSEEELKQASDMVARGMTFQVASEKYKIPISTIRFYMVRKGILQRRKRGRGSSNLGGVNLQPTSPASPPFHMMNYRLPEGLNSSVP